MTLAGIDERMLSRDDSRPCLVHGERRYALWVVLGVLAVVVGAAGLRLLTADPRHRLWVWRMGKTARITWLREPDLAEQQALRQHKHVLVFVGADWDTATKELEEATFADVDVRAAVHDGFIPLYVDMTDDEAPNVQRLQQRYKIIGEPSVFAYAPTTGRELFRISEFRSAEKLLPDLIAAMEVDRTE